jgi:hypothetical protein
MLPEGVHFGVRRRDGKRKMEVSVGGIPPHVIVDFVFTGP